MARVLVLRPQPDADRTARALLARGHAPLLLPLQRIVPTDTPAPTASVAGFIVTSLQAVAPLAAAFPRDPRPALAIGPETAAALRAAGLQGIAAAADAADDLVAAAAALAATADLPLLYAAGRVRLPRLEAALRAAGVAVLAWEVYDTHPLSPGPAEVRALVGDRPPDAALLLSAGQATGFARLAARVAGVFAPPTRLLCLSARIAAGLPAELRPSAAISPLPTLEALFDRYLQPKSR